MAEDQRLSSLVMFGGGGGVHGGWHDLTARFRSDGREREVKAPGAGARYS